MWKLEMCVCKTLCPQLYIRLYKKKQKKKQVDLLPSTLTMFQGCISNNYQDILLTRKAR